MNLRFFGLSLTDTSLVAISDITKHLFDVSLDSQGREVQRWQWPFDRTVTRSNSCTIE
jgi:hypothetical protein